MSKIHTVYKTTNVVNGKFYIGVHKTEDPNDSYLGSGSHLKNAIKKYGRENFSKEVLFCFDTREAAFDKETELVAEHLGSDRCYNVSFGGETGLDRLVDGVPLYSVGALKMNQKLKERFHSDPEYRKRMSEVCAQNSRRAWAEGKIKPIDWTGKKHTADSIAKMAEAGRKRIGSKNGRTGMTWVHHLELKQSRVVKDVQEFLDQGWKLGRKMKF
jgi:hypothetical protein